MVVKHFLVTELAATPPEIEVEAGATGPLPAIPEPAVLGGLMVGGTTRLDTVHARLRSGNFKLHVVPDTEALVSAIGAAEKKAGPAAPVVVGDAEGPVEPEAAEPAEDVVEEDGPLGPSD